MAAYYNEIDPFAAEWLRNLIRDGHIAPGDVDERSIEDVTPCDLIGYEQCHFFAGIGIWSLALRNAGWEDHRRIWTGSCPCQPFSAAGKGDGFDDERHLWPAWFHLIEQCGPDVIMGEQVASKDGLAWLDLVSSDMEGTNHAFWATDTCAAGFGAPHIRQRLYWVANAEGDGQKRGSDREKFRSDIWFIADPDGSQQDAGLGHSDSDGRAQSRGGLPSAGCNGSIGNGKLPSAAPAALPTNGFWRDCDWLYGTDGFFRPVEPGTTPLADGHPTRMGLISAYGNAICAPQAQGFIESVMDDLPN